MPGNSLAQRLADQSHINHLLSLDHVPWYKKPNLRLLYLCIVPAALGVEMTSGYDGSVLNGLQAVQPWLDYFHNPQGAILGVITAAFSIGAVIALPVVPMCNDRLGRKPSIIIGSIIILIGVILQTSSVNIAMFLVARLFLGGGIPFAIGGASQLISELAYPKERGVLTGLFNESWYAGSIIAAGVTLGTFSWTNDWSWRLPSLLQFGPSFLQLVFIWFIPESPRWLVAKGREEEAYDILVKYHAEGDRDSPFVAAEFQEIKQYIRQEVESEKGAWIDLLKTSGNRRRVLIAACVGLFSQWSGNGLVSYYLAKVLATVGITVKRQQNIINLGLQCWNLITGVTGAFITHVLGRRPQYLISYTGMLLVFIAWTAASGVFAGDNSNNAAAGAVVAMIFIYYAFYNTMMPLTYIYIIEIYPFLTRAKGVAITQTFSRAGSAFNQFINPIGLANISWKFYIVYVVWLACELTIIIIFYPETKGPTLEELSTLLDGPDAQLPDHFKERGSHMTDNTSEGEKVERDHMEQEV
ncbi:general substrate transporter [Dacryopinax primogenitus]|uniref:General substrate transporter n=1 Tax=Dacryopinax primogenitus (strain DJM 731) TaxID=1858805 RepID=M5G0K1_DACPD|nr:general substrate transporter [Dacryopinax primogenitus]EJT99356.1 general substrate transporter [Dacryopinax primogenitus]